MCIATFLWLIALNVIVQKHHGHVIRGAPYRESQMQSNMGSAHIAAEVKTGCSLFTTVNAWHFP